MSKTKRLSFDEAFKVLQMGFQWGCGERRFRSLLIYRALSPGHMDEIDPENLTEEMALDAFKEEVRFIGFRIF